MAKKNLLFFSILILVFFFIGFWIGRITEKGKWQKNYNQLQGMSEREINWWKLRLEKFYPSLPEEIHVISGTVKEKGDNFLVIETSVRVNQFPLPGGKEIEQQNIKVNINENTKIHKIEISKPIPLPPAEVSKEIYLKLEDLEIGDHITITAEENIKGKTEILASEIKLLK